MDKVKSKNYAPKSNNQLLLLIEALHNKKERVGVLKDKLLLKLKKHDEKALQAVIEQYSRLVATVINNISKGSLTKEDIEETVADVFVTLWNNADKV